MKDRELAELAAIARQDQELEPVREHARRVAAFFLGLRDAGLDVPEAVHLASDFLDLDHERIEDAEA